MSAELSWSSSLIKPPEINSLMEMELFHLELVAGAKPLPLSRAPSVSGANIETGLSPHRLLTVMKSDILGISIEVLVHYEILRIS